jgi:hypothetical protein
MGFNFKSLTSSALVANNTHAANADNKDVADVPASYAGHTSIDVPRVDEKLGAPRDADPMSSEEELTKVDTTAEQGVQNVQAMTHVWTRRDLIVAYIM